MAVQVFEGDALLWNWARWVWSGPTVGNMAAYIPPDVDYRPINVEHARAVQVLYDTLPWHEQMAVSAEYPQKNARFGGLDAARRRQRARAWIADVTGVRLSDTEYRLYVGLFRDLVGRTVA